MDECLEKLNLWHLRRKNDFIFFKIAFESYYGFGTYCDFCHPISLSERKYIYSEKWEPPENFNCFLCNRQLFLDILNEIILKKNLSSKINEAINFSLNTSYSSFITHVEIEKERNSENRFVINKKMCWGEELSDYSETSLRDDTFNLAILSLSEFLSKNDSQKLKKCKLCNKYYTSNQILRSKFCSNKHKQAWHNKENIKSGKHKEFKRKKRAEGAKPSYYG